MDLHCAPRITGGGAIEPTASPQRVVSIIATNPKLGSFARGARAFEGMPR
jgi:hypothetical protein